MSIEKLKKVIIIAKKEKRETLLNRLYKIGILHVENLDYVTFETKYYKRAIPERNYSEELSKISFIKDIFKEYRFTQQGFLKAFFPEDLEITKNEFNRVVNNFDLNKVFQDVSSLRNRLIELSEEEEKRILEKKYIMSLKSFPFELGILNGTEKTSSIIGKISSKNFTLMNQKETSFLSKSYIYIFESEKNALKIFILFTKDMENEVNAIIKKYKINTLDVKSEFVGFVEEETSRISVRLAEIERDKKIILSKLKEIYKKSKDLQILEEYYSSLNEKESAISKFIEGDQVVIIKGYIKENQSQEFTKEIESSDSFVFVMEPEKSDSVPVSLRNFILFRPFEFLIRLFGVPSYGNIDPTPLVAILFSVFFGIALGDAFYGLVLAVFGGVFANKYSKKIAAKNFFSIMLYGGVMSIIVGLLTGSFAGNFFQSYFPNSFIAKNLSKIQIIDTNSPAGSMNFLIFAIGLGIAAQLLGILTNVIIKFREKDFWNALFNGIGWLLFLPGLIFLPFIKSFPQFRSIDQIILYTGLAFLLLGGWISIRSFFFKPIAAIVNLYGIRSSYGITSFLGDALSYSRLFALGLSSSILASSFNLMARAISNMFGNFGIIPLIIILLITHGLTLVINILGAFIHSIRLNFLEFFGRFYEIGSYEFKPLGLNFKNIRIDEKKEAK